MIAGQSFKKMFSYLVLGVLRCSLYQSTNMAVKKLNLTWELPVKQALMLVNCQGVWRQSENVYTGNATVIKHDLSELKRTGMSL